MKNVDLQKLSNKKLNLKYFKKYAILFESEIQHFFFLSYKNDTFS